MTPYEWPTEVTGFIEAVENNKFAELELPKGYVLITDCEAGGEFDQYVVTVPRMSGELPDDEQETREAEITYILRVVFGDDVDVHGVEWSPENGVFYPSMDRPD